MKLITKIAAIVAMAFASVSNAQQARIETPISTGAGGFTLTVSTPQADGPFDFAMNKGPKVNTINGDTYGELMYGSNLAGSETARIFYKVAIFRDDKANERGKAYSAEVIAQNIIKQHGFVGRAEKFDCPETAFITSSVACYKMHGASMFNEMRKDRLAVTVVAIALKNNTQGFAYIGAVYDSNSKAFDADPSLAIKGATGAAAGMFRNSRLQ